MSRKYQLTLKLSKRFLNTFLERRFHSILTISSIMDVSKLVCLPVMYIISYVQSCSTFNATFSTDVTDVKRDKRQWNFAVCIFSA